MTNDLVDAFMQAAARPSPSTPSNPRLIFSLDATASRQPTWDLASSLTKQMFDAVAKLGGLDVQLVYFRGYGPPVAGPFVDDARRLTTAMSGIQCLSGLTQIEKVLDHIRRENRRQKVAAFIYVGDACEEPGEDLVRKAADLGGPKGFVFHEDPVANRDAAPTLRAIGEKSKGVYLPFDQSSAGRIGDLLAGIAAFAAGGKDALLARNDEAHTCAVNDMNSGHLISATLRRDCIGNIFVENAGKQSEQRTEERRPFAFSLLFAIRR